KTLKPQKPRTTAMTFTAINPANEEILQSYVSLDPGQMRSRAQNSQQAFERWKRSSFAKRSELMNTIAGLLKKNSPEFARLISLEMGKPITAAQAEIEKCAWVCEYYADNAAGFLQDEPMQSGCGKSFVTYNPLGPLLAVMPWNFPFWQVFRFAAPALMAGNTVLLKHASNVPGCALQIEDLFLEAGFPKHVFSTLLIPSSLVDELLQLPQVKGVTLTGSGPAGAKVASQAGSMLKKSVLELGGSDPYLILEDADLEHAARSCAVSRLQNSGQSCIAAKRFIVLQDVLQEFTELFLQQMQKVHYSDPLDPNCTLGPLARGDLRQELMEQVQRSLDQGARLELGGHLPEGPGFWYPPTVLSHVRPGMAAFEEELFGPVAAIIAAKDETEAIQLANQSRFGLGAAVYTRDETRGRRIAAQELEAGSCFVNRFVKSDPRLPFGGIKDSGYGRELSYLGIREFMNTKTVCIASPE
ncbi:MAG: NAD-dependent succinate-semialdehyde dehydrogenase, partial [Desulfohalobiaceae bacterium]